MKEPLTQIVNEGHWIEAQHVAHIMVEFFDSQVISHPAIRSMPGLADRAETILGALGDLYQEIGRVRP